MHISLPQYNGQKAVEKRSGLAEIFQCRQKTYSKTCRLHSSPGGPIAHEPNAADSPSHPNAALRLQKLSARLAGTQLLAAHMLVQSCLLHICNELRSMQPVVVCRYIHQHRGRCIKSAKPCLLLLVLWAKVNLLQD